jgi:phosphoesterase RecJ-like protein
MKTKKITDENVEKVRELIESNDKIVIVTHLSPDGDALGASLGLYHFLDAIEKDVNVVVPNAFPAFLSWASGSKEIVFFDKYPEFAAQLIEDAELIFCLDFNILKRLGDMSALVEKSSAEKVLIDHHLHPDDFCRVVISHPEVSSTGELIFRLICRMGAFDMINKHCAENIYMGMMTDTGAFVYNSNDPDVYFIISQLLGKGIDKDQIYRRVYCDYSENRVRLTGFAVTERMKIYPEYKTAVIYLSLEDLKNHRYKNGDTEGIVNIPLSIHDIVFSVFIREDKDKIKLSFRSVGNFPANLPATEHFGGGGHLNAAGGDFQGSLADAVKRIEEILPLYKHFLNDSGT